MAVVERLKSFGFDKLLLIVVTCIHFVHFSDISAIYCNNNIIASTRSWSMRCVYCAAVYISGEPKSS